MPQNLDLVGGINALQNHHDHQDDPVNFARYAYSLLSRVLQARQGDLHPKHWNPKHRLRTGWRVYEPRCYFHVAHTVIQKAILCNK